MYPQATLKLARSASDQNTFFTYVCLVNEIKPNDNITPNKFAHLLEPAKTNEAGTEDNHIRVERSKALHELVESHRKSNEEVNIKVDSETCSTTSYPTTYVESNKSENDEEYFTGNPNILKLTKMKWLTEDHNEASDSSSPSLSPKSSTTSSQCSRESDSNLTRHMSPSNKYLSTILRLDKEHNLFGLSNIAIVGSRTSKKIRKEAVFHQTAIVQICCGKDCCRHKSNTDLPTSLKCGGCRGCCVDPCCPVCIAPCGPPCGPPCDDTPYPSVCTTCPRGKCKPCPSSKCLVDCTTCFGMKISINRKPKYEPSPCELTPRSSCVLQKPLSARSCHHLPQCIPPSSCFPYLMPCFWPARAAAPCNTPQRCFHNPPCMAPRQKKPPMTSENECDPGGKCEDDSKKTKCKSQTCPGNNPAMKKGIEERFGKK